MVGDHNRSNCIKESSGNIRKPESTVLGKVNHGRLEAASLPAWLSDYVSGLASGSQFPTPVAWS